MEECIGVITEILKKLDTLVMFNTFKHQLLMGIDHKNDDVRILAAQQVNKFYEQQ